MLRNWNNYYQQTKNRPPSSLLRKALVHVKNREVALDLGAGSLNDCRFLISQGFKKVIAVDKEQIPFEFVNEFSGNNFKLIHSSFEQFNFSQYKYDLINAQYSLPFNNAGSFASVWQGLYAALLIGGIFTGQFFGIHDEWYSLNNDMIFHTKLQVSDLLVNFELLALVEEEKNAKLASGKLKYWHTFHVIARRIR